MGLRFLNRSIVLWLSAVAALLAGCSDAVQLTH